MKMIDLFIRDLLCEAENINKRSSKKIWTNVSWKIIKKSFIIDNIN